MKVKLIASTDLGELVCGYAAKVCTSAEMPECPEELAVTRREGVISPFKKALDHSRASGHESVLEHWSATFAIEGISRACSHQLVRHRLASYSQQSQRYVNMGGFEYVTPESISRRREGDADPYFYLQEYDHLMEGISKLYRGMVDAGIPEEDARYILPNACCTNIVVTMNARELRHFLGLRLCKRAQWEIRELAEWMLELLKEECPVLFKDIGPQCEQLGYCREEKGCGRYPDLYGLGEEYWIGHPSGPRDRTPMDVLLGYIATHPGCTYTDMRRELE